MSLQVFLQKAYEKMFRRFGPQHWWPGETPFEIIVGAILTQNTNWGNVERAIANLKKEKLLTPRTLHKIPPAQLAGYIKPAGYFNVKARRLKNFMDFLFAEYGGEVRRMRKERAPLLRQKLLSVNGIGPETADSILLYALDKPIFVVDAYTSRFLYRHNWIQSTDDYAHLQQIFMRHLRPRLRKYNEYHALIVRLGKEYCRPKPLCEQCPLNRLRYSLAQRCPRCFRYLAQVPSVRGHKNLEKRTAGTCGCVK